MLWAGQASPIMLPILDLGVKGKGQMIVKMVRETTSYCLTPTYQISLTYLKRQKDYGPDKLR